MKKRYVVGGVVVLAAVLIGGSALTRGQGGQPKSPTVVAEEPSPTTATGTVQPVRQSKLSFRSMGQIVVLPKVGDQVTEGQEIARLDTAELDLAIAQAEDAVAVNEAQLAQLEAPARPVDLAALEAAYEGARAEHNQLLAGPTKADIENARSAVVSAEAALADAKQQLAALDVNSTQRATEIRNAELALEQAKNTLWAAQIDRDGIKGNGAMPEYMGHSADAKVAAAETAVTQAKAALEAQQATPTEAEMKVAEERVASAETARAAAQAKLDELQNGPSETEKEASAAQVAQAKAALELKQAGAAPADAAVLKARIKQSQTALDQAKAARGAAVITAPLSGVVIWAGSNAGDTVSPGTQVLAVADLSELQVETKDLDEASAAKIALGQPVKVSVNAFESKTLEGTLKTIAPLATTTTSGDANYTATIALAQQDAALRLGMTVKVDFGVLK